MGKTFKRDEEWNECKESALRKERERFKANRARKDSLEDDTEEEDSEKWRDERRKMGKLPPPSPILNNL